MGLCRSSRTIMLAMLSVYAHMVENSKLSLRQCNCRGIVNQLRQAEAQYKEECNTASQKQDKAENEKYEVERVAGDRERRIGILERTIVDLKRQLARNSDDLTVAARMQDRCLFAFSLVAHVKHAED